MKNLLIVLFVLAVLIAGPLLVIWALNTLFALELAYSTVNWLAVVVLMWAAKAQVKVEK